LKASHDMPREKLIELGSRALTNSELIAILLRTGSNEMDVLELSQELLKKFGTLTRLLAADLSEISSIKGIGPAKAVTLKAALEIGNRVFKEIASTTIDSSLLHPREVFKSAIKKAAAAIIVVHNHPSGDPTPSSEDIKITEKLSDAGKIIGIKLLDHVIIGKGKYYSFSASKSFDVLEVQHAITRESYGTYKTAR